MLVARYEPRGARRVVVAEALVESTAARLDVAADGLMALLFGGLDATLAAQSVAGKADVFFSHVAIMHEVWNYASVLFMRVAVYASGGRGLA